MRKRMRFYLLIYIGIPIIILGYLGWQNIPPSGQITQAMTFGSTSDTGIVSPLFPADRYKEVIRQDGNKLVPITNDNVYFNVKFPPLSYDSITLNFDFLRPDNISEIRLGIPRGPAQFENILLSHKYLNSLDWEKLQEGTLVLWQKDKTYDTINDFLATPPRDKVTAVHPTAPTPQLVLPDYQPGNTEIKLPIALQGPHSLFTYVKNEGLFFTFKKQTAEENESTPEHLRILNFRGEEIAKIDISKDQEYEVNIPDLPEGLYRLEILIDKNSVISKIATTQSKLVARNSIWLTDSPDDDIPYNIPTISFLGNNLTALAPTAEGLQEISANERILNITEVEKREGWEERYPEIKNESLTTISFSKTPMKLSGNGYFSLTDTNQLFNPEPPYTFQLSPNTTEAEFEQANFVIAKYNTNREIQGNSLKTQVTLPIKPLYRENDISQFAIFTPGLSRNCDEIFLKKLRVTLTRPPLSLTEIKKLFQKVL